MKPHRNKVSAGWRLDPELLERLAKFQERQRLPVTKTAVIEAALREFLDREDRRRPAP